MKIVIIGADGRKFNEEQEKKAKAVIEKILYWAKEGWLVHPPFHFDEISSILDGKITRVRFTEQQMHFIGVPQITVVSGHCPVGKERWYCVDCDEWLGKDSLVALKHGWKGGKHRTMKVFDNGGVDTWAEIIATKLGIPTEIYPAGVYRWSPDRFHCPWCKSILAGRVKEDELVLCGICERTIFPKRLKCFKTRNIEMAEIGTIGYTIEVAGSCRHCGGTRKQKKADEEGDGLYYDQDEPCNKCKGTGAYSGGTFTINQMKKLGKEVHKIVIK